MKWARLTSVGWLTIVLLFPQKEWREKDVGFFLMKPVPWPRRQHFNLKPYSASIFSINTASLRGGTVSGNLPPNQDLEARPQLFLNKDKTTVVLVPSLSVFSGIPKPPRSKSLPSRNSSQSRQHTKTRLGHLRRRSPAAPRKWCRRGSNLQQVEVFLVVETTPRENYKETS